MSKLCTDIGYYSLNKAGEQLCGDRIDVIESEDGGTITAVLADGLGSGVKACILSTLTSKIISTLMANGMSLEDCVETIAATLPVCAVRGVAYSTFTIVRIVGNREAELIQFDNPHVILLRRGQRFSYPEEEKTIGGKKIYHTRILLEEGDVFVAMSDGVVHAGVGVSLSFGWLRENVMAFLEKMYQPDLAAKTYASLLLNQCSRLYANQPGDDTTALVVKVRQRQPVSLMIGPPRNPADLADMHHRFFAEAGKHIICGGTTARLAADYLGKTVSTCALYSDPDIPPIAAIDGVDLVTEGVITFNRVLEYAKDYLADSTRCADWSCKRDGASLIAHTLFEQATDIHFYVGRAVNPAHQNPHLSISFNIKMRLVEELAACLKKMGKRVLVTRY